MTLNDSLFKNSLDAYWRMCISLSKRRKMSAKREVTSDGSRKKDPHIDQLFASSSMQYILYSQCILNFMWPVELLFFLCLSSMSHIDFSIVLPPTISPTFYVLDNGVRLRFANVFFFSIYSLSVCFCGRYNSFIATFPIFYSMSQTELCRNATSIS